MFLLTDSSLQSENIQLNPEMFAACKDDIRAHCHGIPPGGAQVRSSSFHVFCLFSIITRIHMFWLANNNQS